MFYLKKIKLNNFRCYTQSTFDFSPTKTLIIGENAVGKTSLVEGIYYLCFGKSFRDARDMDVLKKNTDFYYISGEFYENEYSNSKVSIGYDKKSKRIQKNSLIYKSISEYVGYFKTIVFSPDDLALIKGAPLERRKFLDINISQLDENYLKNLIEYKKILKQRNEFLKNSTSEEYDHCLLEVLTTSLIEKARYIIQARKKIIQELNPYIEKIAKSISNGQEIVKLTYSPNSFEDELEGNMMLKEKYDLYTQTTNTGPHRDDVEIKINGEDASTYGSQGQIKTAVLAIKLGLTEYIRKNDDKIIIILDDIFSELDVERQKAILQLIALGNQVFITATDLNSIPDDVIGDGKIIKLRKEEEQ